MNWTASSSVISTDIGDFPEAMYTVTLKRNSMYYVITLFVPAYVITAIGLVGLFTPSSSTMERQERYSCRMSWLGEVNRTE